MQIYKNIRGFNYQPGYGHSSAENWDRFDASVWKKELSYGKKYFPGMNTVRFWLSWEAYFHQPKKFLRNFETALCIADKLKIKVVPVLFNRWHDQNGYDNGGVYLENIVFEESDAYYRPLYKEYVHDIVGHFKDDPRIILWDLCNEPFTSCKLNKKNAEWINGERNWLYEVYQTVKKEDPVKPAGISLAPDLRQMELVDFTDVWLMHPYFFCDTTNINDPAARKNFEEFVDDMLDRCQKTKKPLLVTETCWGATDDMVRSEIIRYTLGVLSRREIGFLVHALAYSGVADLHNLEDGYVGRPGNLAFMNKDGTMRKGHDVFNEF